MKRVTINLDQSNKIIEQYETLLASVTRDYAANIDQTEWESKYPDLDYDTRANWSMVKAWTLKVALVKTVSTLWWEKVNDRKYVAEGYKVWHPSGTDWAWNHNASGTRWNYRTKEEAMAAAQEHFDKR